MLKSTMKKHREDLQMNVSSLRRNIKNLACNYTDAQVKVRKATSNDPWGPESILMSEIADLTYNVAAFTEIMQMVWKRLNDHGKNWRHVYKSLVLLEYLIKTGSEKVGQQCKENIFAIQTLKDFQYYDEMKDQGINVREKAKALVNLLQDEDRLKNERAKALKAKERFAQTASGFGSDGSVYQGSWTTSHDRTVTHDLTSKEIESARPQTVGEEELQLQLALAMSREEAEQEEQRRKSDDVRLQLALSQSQHEFKANSPPQNTSHVLDLLDVNLGNAAFPETQLDPWGMPQRPQRPQVDPWSSSASNPSITSSPVVDPWTPVQPASKVLNTAPQTKQPVVADPWKPVATSSKPQSADPWSPNTDHSSPHLSSPSDLDEFDIITNRSKPISNARRILFVSIPALSGAMANPFASLPQQPLAAAPPVTQNMFQHVSARPTMNQIRQQPVFGNDPLPSSLVPSANPFLS
ncbi:UNVERIFIED_CONTAM: hypothetical protein PYX00_000166 [Menopon gallinae]|uniref:ENTH domain-containing protein n=1 Tax=Menopon gallinae TaxID=328185 RepID=A0AAW2I888_9NEOP